MDALLGKVSDEKKARRLPARPRSDQTELRVFPWERRECAERVEGWSRCSYSPPAKLFNQSPVGHDSRYRPVDFKSSLEYSEGNIAGHAIRCPVRFPFSETFSRSRDS